MGDAVRKIAVYLGLAEDDRYDEDDEFDHEGGSLTRDSSGGSEPGRRALATERGGLRARGGYGRDPAQITTVHPRTYNEARGIGQYFREGIPVLMDLTEMSDDDAKRLVDFAAGLIFGRHGDIDRVADKVFLLSPAGVEVMAGKKAGTSPGG